MVDRLAKRGAVPAPLLWALLGLLIPGPGGAALPPPKEEAPESAGNGSVAAADGSGAPAAAGAAAYRRWLSMLPQTRFGATVGYSMRRDISEDQKATQRGLETSLSGRAAGFIWQPWMARYSGGLNARISQDKSETNGDVSVGRGVGLSGNAQLSVLPSSAYPFEAHYTRSENRNSNDLAASQTYAGSGYGFSQAYGGNGYNVNGGWDRSVQNAGRDKQDTLQLTGGHSQESQRFVAVANLGRNTHRDEEGQTQTSALTNVLLTHNITPTETMSFDNMASVSQSDYRLRQSAGSARASQLSSVGFWRPDEVEVTVVGGVRLLSTQNSAASLLEQSFGAPNSRSGDANVNAGVSYDAIQFTRLNAAFNLNQSSSNGVRQTTGSQSLGVGYQPDSIELGQFHYNWSSGANVSRNGGRDASRQAALQLGHSLNRAFALDAGSNLGLNLNQSLALVAKSATSAARNAAANLDNASGVGSVNADGVRKQLSHGASASWSALGEAASMAASLSATDSRSLDENREFFQSIGFQASSNVPASYTSSWSGNLTIQAVRQSVLQVPGTTGERAGPNVSTNSSGSLTYQEQRLFGVRRLRLLSDLRLNGQSLLPLFGGPQDQEMAAWDTRLDYMIGRTQIRLSFLIARTATPVLNIDPGRAAGSGTRFAKMNKSIAFSISRAIGN